MKEKIRKQIPIIQKILLTFLSLLFMYYFTKSESFNIYLTIKIIVSAIAFLGLSVKLILSYIFPEIILDENGIKIFGREIIKWIEINNIILKHFDNESTTIHIERYYKKRISEDFGKLTISSSDLEIKLNIYLEKYGNKLFRNSK
jgi:hypothetical protein